MSETCSPLLQFYACCIIMVEIEMKAGITAKAEPHHSHKENKVDWVSKNEISQLSRRTDTSKLQLRDLYIFGSCLRVSH